MGSGRTARLIAIVALTAAVTAWRFDATSSEQLPAGRASLAIVERNVPNGVIYMEGAVQVVRVSRGDARSGEQRLPLTLHVRRGRYLVRSATRSCSANCGTLDPPAEHCKAVVTAPVKVVVTTRVGEPCVIRAVATRDGFR
jgi:hypothetical protein